MARDDAPWSTGRFLVEVSPNAPVFAPGAGWRSSNIGYPLARQAPVAATGCDLDRLLADRLCAYPSLRLAGTAADFAGLPFPAQGYHPGWVAHGCALAAPADAARLLADLLARFSEMDTPHPLDPPLGGRVWTRAGYGQGLMSGAVGAADRSCPPLAPRPRRARTGRGVTRCRRPGCR